MVHAEMHPQGVTSTAQTGEAVRTRTGIGKLVRPTWRHWTGVGAVVGAEITHLLERGETGKTNG
jgi:hypothetical protein